MKLSFKRLKKKYEDKGVPSLYYIAFELYEKGEIDSDVFIKYLNRFMEYARERRYKISGKYPDEYASFLLGYSCSKRISLKAYEENKPIIDRFVSLVYYMDSMNSLKEADFQSECGHYTILHGYWFYAGKGTGFCYIKPIFKDSRLLLLGVKFGDFVTDEYLVDLDTMTVFALSNSDEGGLGVYKTRTEMLRGQLF